MNPLAELLGLYHRWQELTAAEGAAIQAEEWAAVTARQREKAALQRMVGLASTRLPGNHARSPELAAAIQALIRQEEENARQLAEKLAASQGQRQDLDRSGQNLRRLRGAYAGAHQSTWQSYS